MAETTDLFLSHNWGDGQKNHKKVIKINEEIKKLGYVTWFDWEKIAGDIRQKMAEGIKNTRCFVAFITTEYHEKVNGRRVNDNCKAEFDYASTLDIPKVAVVLDPAMRDTNQWEGNVALTLKQNLYIDMSKNDRNSRFR